MSYVKNDRYYTDFEDPILPSQIVEQDWLQFRLGGKEYTDKQVEDTTGKWMIFRSTGEVDRLWPVLKNAMQQGLLGMSIKAAPGHPAKDKLVCVYTTDWYDVPDVVRVLGSLRTVGIEGRIYYKADAQTLLFISGSIYCSPKGTEIFITEKGKEFCRLIRKPLPTL
jgi:hypothetical protein